MVSEVNGKQLISQHDHIQINKGFKPSCYPTTISRDHPQSVEVAEVATGERQACWCGFNLQPRQADSTSHIRTGIVWLSCSTSMACFHEIQGFCPSFGLLISMGWYISLTRTSGKTPANLPQTLHFGGFVSKPVPIPIWSSLAKWRKHPVFDKKIWTSCFVAKPLILY